MCGKIWVCGIGVVVCEWEISWNYSVNVLKDVFFFLVKWKSQERERIKQNQREKKDKLLKELFLEVEWILENKINK